MKSQNETNYLLGNFSINRGFECSLFKKVAVFNENRFVWSSEF